jgi:hypothetical protein
MLAVPKTEFSLPFAATENLTRLNENSEHESNPFFSLETKIAQ